MRSLLALATGCLALLGVQVGIVFAQAPAPFAQAPAPAPERFVLSGVIMFDDGQGVAWLQEPTLTQNRVVARRPGESVGPWRLTRVLENRVELQGPAGTVVVPLYNTAALGTETTTSTSSARPRPQRTLSSEAPSDAPAAPAADAAVPGSVPSTEGARSPNRARRIEMLTQMAERGQRDGERARGRAPTAGTPGSPPKAQNPNVSSPPAADSLKGGGLGQLFGGR